MFERIDAVKREVSVPFAIPGGRGTRFRCKKKIFFGPYEQERIYRNALKRNKNWKQTADGRGIRMI